MREYDEVRMEENAYLERTVAFIKGEIERIGQVLAGRRASLISSRKEMWDQTAHYTDDFEKLTEVSQHLSEINTQEAGYGSARRQIEDYRRAAGSPYFGRFDFCEGDSGDYEKIYVGTANIMDPDTLDVLVYDWRAPISSIFYRFETGPASYRAPGGDVHGSVQLKRQYKIADSKLEYFFDCSIRIGDEILQEVLGHNASPKMRNIVETIQKEQDTAIRDTENELLVVQGVAGSGKTSIALHRIAFLLYQGMSSHLSSSNIIIISPSCLFSKYISNVLPELGEENVEQVTFDDIAAALAGEGMQVESRGSWLEFMVSNQNNCYAWIKREAMEFKNSIDFARILDRLITHYERRMIPFEDIYFGGRVIETRQQLKNMLLNNKIRAPLARRLKRIENIILDRLHPLQRESLPGIEKVVQKSQGHDFEIKSFSRLLSIKRTAVLLRRLRKATSVDYLSLYRMLFCDRKLFYRLSKGMNLPQNIDEILSLTAERLGEGFIDYEDCAPALYLKLSLEGTDMFSSIRQVVVDEAQDYYPMHYEVLRLMFRDSAFTVLGDVNQSVERHSSQSIYSSAARILGRKRSLSLSLTKSYRSSVEINRFAGRLLKDAPEAIPFERHEEEPSLICCTSLESMDSSIIRDINAYRDHGYKSMAVLCKTLSQTIEAFSRLKDRVDISLVDSGGSEIGPGAVIIPSYLAKGLEFDTVLLYDVSKESYDTDFDRRLLYISCTRALHRLSLYYTGEKSRFI